MAKIKVYEIITNKILEQLDKGLIPWRKPWISQMPKNLVSKKEYRGVNVLMLSFSDYDSSYWLTFKQCKDKGGHVKKGEKGLPVVYWNWIKVKNRDNDDIEKIIPLMRYYTVFNVRQCEGIDIPDDKQIDFVPIKECEKIVDAMPDKPEIRHGKARACYFPQNDTIDMPNKEIFINVEQYYCTLYHELIHSTGHEKRLNRQNVNDISPFGSENYSKEELIAEIGASFLSGITGIENKTIDNSYSYIGNWLQKLRKDKKLIIVAASQAQKACDYIMNRKYDN